MADTRKIRLYFNEVELILTDDKYTENYIHVDSWNVSEAGTNLRAVVRTHIPSLSISYKCDATEKANLDTFDQASRLTCSRWDESTETMIDWPCCMVNYSADLIIEDNSTRWYKVSFKLNDLEE